MSTIQPKTRYCVIGSPVGLLTLVDGGDGLSAIHFSRGPLAADAPAGALEDFRPFRTVVRQLEEYFRGGRTTFELPLALSGTPFQLAVWNALKEIPFGETRSYSEIAHAIGRPDACRAVGAANGRNPIPIVIPCHRVVGADGSLTGFGGGLQAKRWLLDHETQHALF